MNKDLELMLRRVSWELASQGNVRTESLENLDVALNGELARRQDLMEQDDECTAELFLKDSNNSADVEIIYDGPFMEFRFPETEKGED